MLGRLLYNLYLYLLTQISSLTAWKANLRYTNPPPVTMKIKSSQVPGFDKETYNPNPRRR